MRKMRSARWRIDRCLTADPFCTVTILDAGRLVVRITVARNGTGDFPASPAVGAMAPLRHRPLGLGVVHGIIRVLVDDVVELEDLRLARGQAVDYRDAVLLVQADVVERRVLLVGVHDERYLRRGPAWQQIGTRFHLFGPHVFVAIAIGQGEVRSIRARAGEHAHHRPLAQRGLAARNGTHLPWAHPPSRTSIKSVQVYP